MSQLSLTDADREEMLAAIGVSSVEELFARHPGRRALPGRARPRAGARRSRSSCAHLEELAREERRHDEGALVPRRRDLRPLRARGRRRRPPARRVPDRVHAVPAGDEPGRAAGDLRVPDGDLRADRAWTSRTRRATTGRPSPPTPASSRSTRPGRSKVVLAETLNPQARQVVKTYAPGFGLEVVEVPHDGGAIDPAALREAAEDAAVRDLPAAERLRLPRGGARRSPPRRTTRGALAVAHVDPVSLGVLEAPGNYGCAMAIGEGQGAGNYQSYAGPHYGFLAAKAEYTRRLPGRIIGETTDLNGERGYVLTLQTREQHIRREKATSNITTNQTLLALAGLVHLSLARPAGAARGRGDVHGPRRLREGEARACRSRSRTSRRSRSSRCGSAGPARDVIRRRARARRPPRLRDRPRLRGHGRRAADRGHREAQPGGHRPARPGARGGARLMELIYEKSKAGPARLDAAALRPAGCRRCPRSCAAPSRRACPSSPSRRSSATSPRSRPATSGSTPASTRSAAAR